MGSNRPRRSSTGVGMTALVLGALLLIVGTIWIFQGVGMLKGSFMTGESLWAWLGAVCVLFALPLLTLGIRRRR